MNDPYAILGLDAGSDEAAVRSRYLELVRQFPPEKAPERFAEIRKAYEQLQDRDERLTRRLSRPYRADALDGLADALVAAAARPRMGLEQLLAAHRVKD